MKLLTVAIFCSLAALAVTQKDPNFADGRNTIVHLFEWKWTDIATECEDFLGPNGYAGVQISPPSENQIITDPYRPWWERYQPVSYILETRSGTESELSDMIERCNAVGVRIYADLILNHMASYSGTGTAGSSSDPSSKSYPAVPYTSEDFHETCSVSDYNNATNVRYCELVGLPDLDQSSDSVAEILVEYMDSLIDLGVAGFRVDAAKHMLPADLEVLYNMAKDLSTDKGFSSDTRPFFYQEVIDFGRREAIAKTEYINFGRVLDFKFGTELGVCFQGNNPIHWLVNWGPGWGILDDTDAVVFIDNHDNQRGSSSAILTYKNPRPYRSAIAFMLAHPLYVTNIISSFEFDTSDQGPPNTDGVILSPGFNEDGSCTNGWVCEHRWAQIYRMVEFRNVVDGEDLENWWDNGDNQIAFSRGSKGFAAFTVSGDINTSITTGLPAGTYCDVISGYLESGACTGKSVVVDSDGLATITLSESDEDGVLAIHINAKY